MPKPTEIVAALGDVSAIESYATLQAEMVDLFITMADGLKKRNRERPAQIMRKMAASARRHLARAGRDGRMVPIEQTDGTEEDSSRDNASSALPFRQVSCHVPVRTVSAWI
jgi:hypothetical protein